MAQAYGIRMLTSDGCAALRTITEENVLNVILAAMTMTANAQRTIVSKNDINYALDLKRV
jgi:histone H3/H4